MSARSPQDWEDESEPGFGQTGPLPYGEPGPIRFGSPLPIQPDPEPPPPPRAEPPPQPAPPPQQQPQPTPRPQPPPTTAYVHQPEVFGAPPRRIARPEPTYPPPYKPPPHVPPEPEPARQYFTPLPDFTPTPPQPAAPIQPVPVVIVRSPGWLRGLFIGSAIGVIIGGVAGLTLERMSQPRKLDVILPEPKPLAAEAVVTDEPLPAAPRKKPAAKSAAKPAAKPKAAAKQSTNALDLDRLARSIGETSK